MRKILLAVGHTAAAVEAARQVRPWLKERNTALTLVSVVPSSPLSPLSPFKRALEQTEAVFTSAEEQPGIVLRVGNDPAAELCHELHQGQYHLLALARSHSPAEGTIGTTCRALLTACSTSMLITPSTLHVGTVPQVVIVTDGVGPTADMTGWLTAQCSAQQLNVALLARRSEDAAPLHQTLEQAGVRSQVIVRPEIDAPTIYAQAQERRVRWIVLPFSKHSQDTASLERVIELLSHTSCPVLLAEGSDPSAPSLQN